MVYPSPARVGTSAAPIVSRSLSVLAASVAVLLALADPAAAQSKPEAVLRANALGEVRTLGGDPWVGARVTLVSVLVPGSTIPEMVDVITTVTSKSVLILGRFTEERKAVLDSIRVELRKCGLVPIVFDWPASPNQISQKPFNSWPTCLGSLWPT